MLFPAKSVLVSLPSQNLLFGGSCRSYQTSPYIFVTSKQIQRNHKQGPHIADPRAPYPINLAKWQDPSTIVARPYVKCYDGLSIHNGILFKGSRIIIPAQLMKKWSKRCTWCWILSIKSERGCLLRPRTKKVTALFVTHCNHLKLENH